MKAKALPAPPPPPSPKLAGAEYKDFTLDDRNLNRGTKRGLELLEESLRRFGAGRSILVDKNGRVVAGNKTLERAAELGLKLREVKTTGEELVVVRREDVDLDTPEGRALALADNRVQQVDFDLDVGALRELAEEGVPVDLFYFPEELADLFKTTPASGAPHPSPAAPQQEVACPQCGHVFQA